MPIFKKTKWWNTYDSSLLFNFNSARQYLIPNDTLFMVTMLQNHCDFLSKVMTVPDWIHNKIQSQYYSSTQIYHPFSNDPRRRSMKRPLSQSLGHREEHASPGSNEVEANMFDLIEPDIAGKYTGKDGLKILIHLAFKVSLLWCAICCEKSLKVEQL